jgi:hypothetical protein
MHWREAEHGQSWSAWTALRHEQTRQSRQATGFGPPHADRVDLNTNPRRTGRSADQAGRAVSASLLLCHDLTPQEHTMSTSFRPLSPLRISDVFSGRLEKHGIHEHISQMHTTDTCRCLTDGQSGLWVFADEDGLVTTCLAGASWDLAEAIVAKIMREFGVEIVNSQFPQYYGFETQEEMDAAEEEAAREYWDGSTRS